ncbi:MAG TPA: hypothetical protein VGR62_06180 [Candidatus Binatia bacterium]|nr:hypothetical protein [Candidatus Binatia bacterium]
MMRASRLHRRDDPTPSSAQCFTTLPHARTQRRLGGVAATAVDATSRATSASGNIR